MTIAKAVVAGFLAALTVLVTLVTPHSVVWIVGEVLLAGLAAGVAVWRVPNEPSNR
jgi:hypothetical protein